MADHYVEPRRSPGEEFTVLGSVRFTRFSPEQLEGFEALGNFADVLDLVTGVDVKGVMAQLRAWKGEVVVSNYWTETPVRLLAWVGSVPIPGFDRIANTCELNPYHCCIVLNENGLEVRVVQEKSPHKYPPAIVYRSHRPVTADDLAKANLDQAKLVDQIREVMSCSIFRNLVPSGGGEAVPA